jgi:hypothetical protein
MAFSPTITLLYDIDQLEEYVNFTQSITYEDDTLPGEFWGISITPDTTNPTVNVSGGTAGGTISGYYSNAFDPYSITYLQKSNTYNTVADWNNIINAKEIVSYQPALIQTRTYTYTVTATSATTGMTASLDYIITVTNNWTAGKNRLKSAIAQTKVGT